MASVLGTERTECYRFGFTTKDLKTSLHETFNTTSFRILDAETFEKNALDALATSLNPLDFYDRMGRLRDARREELHCRFEYLGYHALLNPDILGPDPDSRRWDSIRGLLRNQSVASLVGHLAAFMPEINDHYFNQRDPQRMKRPKPHARPPPPRIFERDQLADSVQTVDTLLSPPSSPHPAMSEDEPFIPWIEPPKPRRSSRLANKPRPRYAGVKKPRKHPWKLVDCGWGY